VIRRDYEVKHVSLPEPYDSLLSAARTINDYEGARSHYERWQQFGDGIGRKLSELVQRGMQTSDGRYREKLALIQQVRESMNRVFDEFSILLTPAALGAAPEGLASTGDPIMNAVWTALGVPVIGLPMSTAGPLPLGLQMIARHHSDAMLLSAASAMTLRL
jgi:Asp-tRNA(Asn)/Glu-tRNA(Gln) amidotransferase A subunit family amidase